ncbi:hypothetical protein LTS18_005759 [Coniosporium uncinatum]|uniref:Uncharacterized protein n=1 Tax=Coniosporium uncinatum TaxID=93489 RepID=A0ACC3D4R1_9PEZI|nr:hypothetical protein LTS18_005759 [Coniosporium uncinatum]
MSSHIPGIGLAQLLTVDSNKAFTSEDSVKETTPASNPQPDIKKQEEIRRANELKEKLKARLLERKTREPETNRNVPSPAPDTENRRGSQQEMLPHLDGVNSKAQAPVPATSGSHKDGKDIDNLRTNTSEAANEFFVQRPMSSNPTSSEPGTQIPQTMKAPPTGPRALGENVASSRPQPAALAAVGIVHVVQSTLQQPSTSENQYYALRDKPTPPHSDSDADLTTNKSSNEPTRRGTAYNGYQQATAGAERSMTESHAPSRAPSLDDVRVHFDQDTNVNVGLNLALPNGRRPSREETLRETRKNTYEGRGKKSVPVSDTPTHPSQFYDEVHERTQINRRSVSYLELERRNTYEDRAVIRLPSPSESGELLQSMERHPFHYDDLDEWLELTGYHDPAYRTMKIDLSRRKAAISAAKDEIEDLEDRLESTRSTGRRSHPPTLRDSDARTAFRAYGNSMRHGSMGDGKRLHSRYSPAEDDEQEQTAKRARTGYTPELPANLARYPATKLTQAQRSPNKQKTVPRRPYRASYSRRRGGPPFAASEDVIPVRAGRQRGAAFGSRYWEGQELPRWQRRQRRWG